MSNYEPLPSFSGESTDAPVQPGAADYATWIRRVGAYLLDAVVFTAVATIIAAATGHHDLLNTFKYHLVNGKEQLEPYGSELNFFIGTGLVLQVLYTAFLASRWQATLGMRALGIYIAREADHGKVGLVRAEARTFVVLIAAEVLRLVVRLIASLVIFLDMLWPLWDARNQTLHDKVARTVVLRRVPGS
ncbi:MAG TPA: RDD family protein [Acidimicrobiales bacterium]|jgi:uncharacterized RDD family membrane protein YckC|nr:RDD family protein [Acidimicrobiales bacterium]